MSNFSHLTLSDRIAIERYLSTGYSLKGIAEAIHRSPSTISREIRNHRTFIKAPTENERMCPQLSKPPYICNNCRRRNLCNYNQAYYQAQKAQKMYETELSESRKGIHLNEEELVRMDELFSPLLKNGQSLGHIFSSHSDEIPVCRRLSTITLTVACLKQEILIFQEKYDTKGASKKSTKTMIILTRKVELTKIFKSFLKRIRIWIMLKWIPLRVSEKKENACLR